MGISCLIIYTNRDPHYLNNSIYFMIISIGNRIEIPIRDPGIIIRCPITTTDECIPVIRLAKVPELSRYHGEGICRLQIFIIRYYFIMNDSEYRFPIIHYSFLRY